MDRRRGFIQRRFFCERKFPNARERVLEASSKTREPTRNEFECSKHQHSKYFRFYRLSVFARKRKQRAWISSNFTPSSDRTFHISRTKKKRRLEKLLRATIATNASPVPLNEAETEVPTKEDAERENMLLVYMF